jgi:glycosyltransferase involved in cell wall biosynthesis
MHVTIAICTWNRAGLLDRTLAEMHALRVPHGVDWELLVVNNNCTDNSDEVIARHTSRLPLRRVFEPEQGHSAARNRALAEANGELLLWTDDDVLVDQGWIEAYVTAANYWPAASFFGGPVDPWFEIEPVPWLLQNFQRIQGAYAVRHFGREVRPFKPDERPIGANMAFRTSVLRQYSFRTDLGRHGNSMTSGDDIELLERMQGDGYVGVCVGTARVRHFIPKERLGKDYLWRLNYGAGRTHVRLNGVPVCPHWWGVPRWAVRKYCQCRLESWLLTPFKSRRWLEAFIHTAQLRGLIDECREARRKSGGASVNIAATREVGPAKALE